MKLYECQEQLEKLGYGLECMVKAATFLSDGIIIISQNYYQHCLHPLLFLQSFRFGRSTYNTGRKDLT